MILFLNWYLKKKKNLMNFSLKKMEKGLNLNEKWQGLWLKAGGGASEAPLIFYIYTIYSREVTTLNLPLKNVGKDWLLISFQTGHEGF